MSSEKAIVVIENVRKKLEKYVQTKQDEKVRRTFSFWVFIDV